MTVAGKDLVLATGIDGGIEVPTPAVDAAHPHHNSGIADRVAAGYQFEVGDLSTCSSTLRAPFDAKDSPSHLLLLPP